MLQTVHVVVEGTKPLLTHKFPDSTGAALETKICAFWIFSDFRANSKRCAGFRK